MTTTKLFSQYQFSTTPGDVPITESAVWDEDLVRAAGFDPDDDEVTISQLAEPWNGHAAGALVVVGLTMSGYPFAVEVMA